MVINILVLSYGFEAINYDQSHVDAYRKNLVYQLSVNLVKIKLLYLKLKMKKVIMIQQWRCVK